MLVERNMTDLTFEALAIRHAGKFDGTVLDAAKERLSAFASTPKKRDPGPNPG